MKPSQTRSIVMATLLTAATLPCLASQSAASPRVLDARLRQELLDAREAVWRAFFQKDTARLEGLLGPELIAVQEAQENWERRSSMITIAKSLNKAGVELLRLEFPHTEIQLFGDTAILYYTYIFSTGVNGKPDGVDAGRGTEVFVLRNRKWLDVGWHLDNGPFTFQNGAWKRLGEYPPVASASPQSPPASGANGG